MHEQSETVMLPDGTWHNIYGANTKTPGQRLPNTPTYPTLEQAEEAARARSRQHGLSDALRKK